MKRKIYNLYEAKTALSSLVERAANGEDIVIAKAGVPKARLVAVRSTRSRRQPGGWEGKVWIADDFDAPLPDEVRRAFSEHDDDGR